MVLTVDIGNTNATLGAYKDDKLVFTSRLNTDKKRLADQYACELKAILNLHNSDENQFSGAIISCVVPEVLHAISDGIKTVIHKEPLIVGPGIKTGLNIHIDVPSSLGADLVTSGVGAKEKYPLPCLIVDLGTASKITVIDENGNFCGGAIAPGVRISLNALSESASLLPNISLNAPKKAIGKNTVDCLRSGVVFGTAAMIDGMVERIKEEISFSVKTVVITGGLSKNIAEHCKTKMIYDENLILDGLKNIYDKNVNTK